MPTFLFTVNDSFDIAGRYIIPVPGVPPSIRGIRNGLPIELRRPNGTVLRTEVASVPMIDPHDPKRPTQIGLRGLSKEDIPLGTEIWMIDEPVAQQG